MKLLRKILKWIGFLLLIPIGYLLLALLLSAITIDGEVSDDTQSKIIYLATNGIHLDVIIARQDADPLLLSGLNYNTYDRYLAFGWGDADFYVNTPTWGDLTFSTAFKAMFLESATLMHVTRYRRKRQDWIEIKVTESQFERLNRYLLKSFDLSENDEKMRLDNAAYTAYDDFYKANGSYSCFYTCNTWVNTAFKKSGLKSSFWTPFDFGLMNKYR